MEKPVRVLLAMGKMFCGGVEILNMNYYCNMDHSFIQCDFAVNSDSTFPQQEAIQELGGKTYRVPSYKRPFSYIYAMYRILKKNHYSMINANMNTLNFLPLFAAWMAGTKVRICFNHSTANCAEGGVAVLKYLLRPIAALWATDYFACGKYSAEWMYGKRRVKHGDVTIIRPSVDLSKFTFDGNLRYETRKKLNLQEKRIIGHIGRFVTQKNHDFLINVFQSIHQKDRDTVLLLVGDGPLLEEIKKKVSDMGLDTDVYFLEPVKDIEKYYSCMDLLCFPSFFEGFPAVVLEAQAERLPVLVSDAVTTEVDLTEHIHFLSLEEKAEVWADAAINILQREYERIEIVPEALVGFDIQKNACCLQKKYLQLLES